MQLLFVFLRFYLPLFSFSSSISSSTFMLAFQLHYSSAKLVNIFTSIYYMLFSCTKFNIQNCTIGKEILNAVFKQKLLTSQGLLRSEKNDTVACRF